ncbi:MAG: GTP-binding protein TypA, partial [Actinobacteria bacterium]|nr:GTP-binding protein TypA [Actinomycetota bacterium]
AARIHTLETAIEWIADDELVEITPKTIRIRKRFLGLEDRRKAYKKTS